MKRIIKRSLIFFPFFILSCAKKKSEYLFPKEVKVDQWYEGDFEYSSDFDTIKLRPQDSRYLFFYVATGKNEFNSIKEIELSKNRYAFAEDSLFSKLKYRCYFDELGNSIFTGIVKDEVIIDNYKDGKSRILTKETKIVFDTNVVQ